MNESDAKYPIGYFCIRYLEHPAPCKEECPIKHLGTRMEELPADIIQEIGDKLCVGSKLQWALTNKRVLTIIQERYKEEILQYKIEKEKLGPRRDFLRLMRVFTDHGKQSDSFLETLTYEIIRQHPTWLEGLTYDCYTIQNNQYRICLWLKPDYHGKEIPVIQLNSTRDHGRWKHNDATNYAYSDGCYREYNYHRNDFSDLIKTINPPHCRLEHVVQTSCANVTVGAALDMLFSTLQPTQALMTNLVHVLLKKFGPAWYVSRKDKDIHYQVGLDNYSFDICKNKLTILKNDLNFYECVYYMDESKFMRIPQIYAALYPERSAGRFY